ncbi:Uncharacterized RNA methyltransferase pc1998 [Seminavis robusta]|uniref:Uncharacterized RNA methyltransferase pc1998 n=1 Tax=Seminavis robusta TaxID=568900 RepID=A0A9N8DLT5_9STRA|nr:Uncharacterized RNA methyltransferase pc1998 [Seminavis robusta]|eukprot:Sro228_g092560.1 Uncharacterized RNA methyltransferase pc1998 (621) ;mRNA; r:14242-16308
MRKQQSSSSKHESSKRQKMGTQGKFGTMMLLCLPFLTTDVSAFAPTHLFLQPSLFAGVNTALWEQRRSTSNRNSDGSQKQRSRRRRPTTEGTGGTGRNNNRNSNNKNGKRSYRVSNEEARPILTNYDANTSPQVNQERLHRATIDCGHFDTCSGCSVQTKIANIPTIQSAQSFFSSPWIRQSILYDSYDNNDDNFYQVVVPSPLTSWRTQAKLVAAPKSSAWSNDGIQLGLYRSKSHQVVAIPQCAVHHPSINRAMETLEQATAKAGIVAYSSAKREGALRYVQFQVERTTGKVSMTLVWNAETIKQTQPALSRLVKELQRLDPDLWHSVWVNCNDSTGNNILARNPNRWHRITGPEFLREPLPVGDKGWLYFTPLTFRQGNLDGFDILANDVASLVPENAKVCELYAGVGLLGLSALAHQATNDENGLYWLRCSDENPSNARCFERAVDSLPPDWVGRGNRHDRKKPQEEEITIAQLMERMQSGDAVQAEPPVGDKTSYMVASAAKALKSGQALGANVIIVDPPRKGLEFEVLDELCKPIDRHQDSVEDVSMLTIPDEMARWTNDARTLIYVSCGFEALARDAERLLTSKAGWKLESATGYILFPGSDHVETVCVFQRD